MPALGLIESALDRIGFSLNLDLIIYDTRPDLCVCVCVRGSIDSISSTLRVTGSNSNYLN